MLTIRNPEAERIAHELASQRGQAVDDVVLAALKAEQRNNAMNGPGHAGAHAPLTGTALIEAAKRIQERVASRPMLDHRPDDEILGYNEHGTFE